MKKDFSFYEFVGVIAPGTVVLLVLLYVFPDAVSNAYLKDFSISKFGIFIIVAYVAGHLIQSVGNVVERVWWYFFGGMPTTWVIRKGNCPFLSDEQHASILPRVSSILKLPTKYALQEYSAQDWFSVARQIYAAVKTANAAERVDIFNGNYGFFRGIAASLILAIILVLVKARFTEPSLLAIFCITFAMAIARMHLFGKHYARELYIQFLQLQK